MRTTLDLDDELLQRAIKQFPPGTPKTVILEEGLRALLERAPPRGVAELGPDVARLVGRGVLSPPARVGPPPQSALDPLPPGVLGRDLARDREDR